MAGSITISSNLAALNAQRRLGQNTKALEQTCTRLSSGLRINRASDDAAGLAISESLNVDARVYNQGVRNLNDSISLVNIAEAAVRELTAIRTRQKELAEQAANGTLSGAQRNALNEEANALVAENNRIIAGTEYNGLNLLSTSLGSLGIQAGYGQSGGLNFGLLTTRLVDTPYYQADGTFRAETTFSAGSKWVASEDVNNDGKLDLIALDNGNARVCVLLGNGDGTFKAKYSYAVGTNPLAVIATDLNGDSKVDLATVDSTDNTVSVFLGAGNGSFGARNIFASAASLCTLTYGDFNGDGKVDLALSNSNPGGVVYVMAGVGNGTFGAPTCFSTGARPISITSADLDGDGKLDLITGDVSGNSISVHISNGNGTFKGRVSLGNGVNVYTVAAADVNGDGIQDIIAGGAGGISIFQGNGNGTFKARSSFAADSTIYSVCIADQNADGKVDIVASSASSLHVYLGNGNGTFGAVTSSSGGGSSNKIVNEDFNGDGMLDIAAVKDSGNSVALRLGGGLYTYAAGTPIPLAQSALDLTTSQGALAALTSLTEELTTVTNELGLLGSIESRLATAVSHLEQTRENYLNAKSQITDVDVAQEAAELVRKQILQKSSSAVLAQAGQAPQLALALLKNIGPGG